MSDSDLIDQLGGPAKVCDLLHIPRHGGVQRVQNWKARGIPARVKLERPDLFLPTREPTASAQEPDHAPS
jgi:hypothetical protein